MRRTTAVALAVLLALPSAATAQSAASLDGAARRAVIDSLTRRLDSVYVFPEVARQLGSALRDRARHGAYDRYADPDSFAAALTRDLRSLGHDVHLGVDYSADRLVPSADFDNDSSLAARRREWEVLHNYGFPRVEILPGNIGYLAITSMMDPATGGPTAAAAMNFIAHTDALILDLRENHGGSPAMVAFLLSYLFDGRVHLNDFAWRGQADRQQSWTVPYVPGLRYGNRPVYVLTSRRTVSAGEEFAYDLQANRRATIIGEVTAGGANPGGMERLTDHFKAFIPVGRAINPVTGTNWEGVGVMPDRVVPAAAALIAAQRAALDMLFASGPPGRRELVQEARQRLQPAGGR